MEKILIIDDEKDWVSMLAMRLSNKGYKTAAAFDAVCGMMQLKNFDPDVILLDIIMPAGGGITLLKNIRMSAYTFKVPVIVITGIDDAKIRKEAEGYGISGYFVKPLDIKELIKKIAEIFIRDKEDTINNLGSFGK